MLDGNGHDNRAHLEARLRELELAVSRAIDNAGVLVDELRRLDRDMNDYRAALAAATRREPAD